LKGWRAPWACGLEFQLDQFLAVALAVAEQLIAAGERPHLCRGPVRLLDGRTVDGILFPRALAEGRHKHISAFGDWRAYVTSLRGAG
jgi:allophanate hydrolase-like protein